MNSLLVYSSLKIMHSYSTISASAIYVGCFITINVCLLVLVLARRRLRHVYTSRGHAPWLAKTSIMVVSCCAVGCRNRYGERPGLGFFRFPLVPDERRKRWVIAVKRDRWNPSRICGDHFISGTLYSYNHVFRKAS